MFLWCQPQSAKLPGDGAPGPCANPSPTRPPLSASCQKTLATSLRTVRISKSPVVVLLAFSIHRNTLSRELFQNSIQIIHLEVEHRRLRNREIARRTREEGNCNVGTLRFVGKQKRSMRTGNAKVFLVPGIESLRIVRSHKRSP